MPPLPPLLAFLALLPLPCGPSREKKGWPISEAKKEDELTQLCVKQLPFQSGYIIKKEDGFPSRRSVGYPVFVSG